MAADAHDSRDPRDLRDQLRADRERHRAEERADAPAPGTWPPPPDWRHDTLELDLDEVRAATGPPPVVGGSVLSSRTHRGGWRAVRQGCRRAARGVRGVRVRVAAGLVVGLVLLVGAGAASAVLDGSGTGPQTSPLQTTTVQTGSGDGSAGGSAAVPDAAQQPAGQPAGQPAEQPAGQPAERPAGPAALGGGAPQAPEGPPGGPGPGPGPGAGPAGAPAHP